MRGTLVGGLLAVVAAGAALALAGTAGAQGGDPTSLAMLIDDTQQQLGRLATVQVAAGNTNSVWAVGGLAGLGVGLAIGSVATYFGWRR